ncbi:SRPBCC family protein [Labrys neptuniae]
MTILRDATEDRAAENASADDLVFESLLEAPPAKVWRALTVPAYAAAWLLPEAERAEVDSAAPDLVECKLLASEAPRLLSYAWREKVRGGVLDSIVTFELDSRGENSTHLRITHGGFRLRPAAVNLNQPTMLLAA